MAHQPQNNDLKKAKVELLEHLAGGVASTNNHIQELPQQLADVIFYIERLRFRRNVGLPPEDMKGSEGRGKE